MGGNGTQARLGAPLIWNVMNLLPVEVIRASLHAGVTEFVVCSGARDSPLIVVLAAAEAGGIRLWQHFEERAAAFFALGRIRATGRPVAVITTSGTAVAELLPAIIEAHYQGLPLVAITADRPACYRRSGAPQSIAQPGIFGPYVSACHDVELPGSVPVLVAHRAPLHLNICLPEPDSALFPAIRTAAQSLTPLAPAMPPPQAAPGPPTTAGATRLILCGDILPAEQPIVLRTIIRLGGLVYAEAASGLRDHPALGDRLLRCGDASLADLPVQEIFRFGGVPACRFWRDLESAPEIPVTSWAPSGYSGLARPSTLCRSLTDIPAVLPAQGETAEIIERENRLQHRLRSLLNTHPESEPALVARLSTAIPSPAVILTGNSLSVREWNLCAVSRSGHEVHALRGANGIDGNLSAFLGLAASHQEAWCLTGDLTALYDLSAPWMLRQLPPGRRRFVIMHNKGGKIFSRLPALHGLNTRERQLMENPHQIRFSAWARQWDMDYLCGGSSVLRDPRQIESLGDHAVIELTPDPVQTSAFWEEWARAAREL